MFGEAQIGESSQIWAGGGAVSDVVRAVGRGVPARINDGAELPDPFLMPSKK